MRSVIIVIMAMIITAYVFYKSSVLFNAVL